MFISLANRCLLVVGLVVAGGACAGCGQPDGSMSAPDLSPSASAPTSQPANAVCPTLPHGVMSSVADTDGGVAITFTARADRVDAVRVAVRHMAEHENMMASCSCCGMMRDAGTMGEAGAMGCAMMGDGGMMGDAGGMMGCGMMDGGMTADAGMPGMMMPPATAQAEDIPGGARLTLTAKNPADIDALRTAVRAHVDRMTSGACSMM